MLTWVKVATKPNTEKKASGQGGRLGPPVGPGQRPGGCPGGKAPRSSMILATQSPFKLLQKDSIIPNENCENIPNAILHVFICRLFFRSSKQHLTAVSCSSLLCTFKRMNILYK